MSARKISNCFARNYFAFKKRGKDTGRRLENQEKICLEIASPIKPARNDGRPKWSCHCEASFCRSNLSYCKNSCEEIASSMKLARNDSLRKVIIARATFSSFARNHSPQNDKNKFRRAGVSPPIRPGENRRADSRRSTPQLPAPEN